MEQNGGSAREDEVEDGLRAERGDDRRTRKTLQARSIPCDRNDPQARALRGDAMRSLTFLASRLAPFTIVVKIVDQVGVQPFPAGRPPGLSIFAPSTGLEKSDFSARENSSFFGKPYAAVLLGDLTTTRVFYLTGILESCRRAQEGFPTVPCFAPAFFSEREVNFLGDGVTTISTEAAFNVAVHRRGGNTTAHSVLYRGKTRGKRWRERTRAHLKERERE